LCSLVVDKNALIYLSPFGIQLGEPTPMSAALISEAGNAITKFSLEYLDGD